MKVNYLKLKKTFQIICLFIAIGLSSHSQAQSASYGNIYIHGNSEMMIFGEHIFMYQNTGNMPGIVGTERKSPMGFMSFNTDATWKGALDSQHVDGYVKSYKTTPFVFPIGDNGMLRPAMVSTSSVSAPNSAAYFRSNPSIAITNSVAEPSVMLPVLPTGGPFNINSKEVGVFNVDSVEYWDINGTTAANISLTWNPKSYVNELTKGDYKNLSIVGWDGTKWVNIPSKVDPLSVIDNTTASSLTNGSITTTSAIVPDNYKVYTLGYFCDTPKGVAKIACNTSNCSSICKTNNPTAVFTVTGFTGATGYIWTATGGITVVSGQGTATAVFNFASATVGNASISVQAYSNCDTGSANITSFAVIECTPENILDTTIATKPGTNVVIGPETVPGPGETITTKLEGPFHGSGTATIDNKGIVTFFPDDTLFIGKDTVKRIICIMYPDSSKKCDTSYIFVNNPGPTFVLVDTTKMNTPNTYPAMTAVKFEGNPVAPVIDPKLKINADGTVTFTPKQNFVGVDTAIITRCDDKGNCVKDVFILVVSSNIPDDSVQTPFQTPIQVPTNIITSQPGMSVTMTATAGKNGTTVVNADNSVTYTPNKGFEGVDSFVRIVCITYVNGNVICDTSMVFVTVLPEKEGPDVIPNYFSPNGDGSNDIFDLTTLTKIYPNLKLEVYNRWGNSVYRSPGPYKNDWDGTNQENQKPLPDGVYYYIIELDPKFSDVKSGFVQIMRM